MFHYELNVKLTVHGVESTLLEESFEATEEKTDQLQVYNSSARVTCTRKAYIVTFIGQYNEFV